MPCKCLRSQLKLSKQNKNMMKAKHTRNSFIIVERAPDLYQDVCILSSLASLNLLSFFDTESVVLYLSSCGLVFRGVDFRKVMCCAVLSHSVLSEWLHYPMDCSPPGSSVHGDSPNKNTGVGCHTLLQGIFPTQGLNSGLLHCRGILYHLSHQGSRKVLRRWQIVV